MAIQVKPDTERLLQEELQIGHFQTVDDLIVESVHAWREKFRQVGPANSAGVARSLEQEWLKLHQTEYAGAWVALEGASLVAQGLSARQVLDTARSAGYEHPLVVHIPNQTELPFGGW